MQTFYFITVHPQMISTYQSFGLMKSCEEKSIAQIKSINLREYSIDKHGSVDAAPYGGGDGMVLRIEPLVAALESLPEEVHCIAMTPAGKLWKQEDAERLAESKKPIAFICGRFAGMDERFLSHYADEEISIGDYIVTGGELPSLVITESILRLLPNALGNEQSAKADSLCYENRHLLEYPLYTRPAVFRNLAVPDVLLSGDHELIAKWRKEQSILRTKIRRPDIC